MTQNTTLSLILFGVIDPFIVGTASHSIFGPKSCILTRSHFASPFVRHNRGGYLEGNRSVTMPCIESYWRGSTASSSCFMLSARSLGVGLRPGTVAANSTGSKRTRSEEHTSELQSRQY